MLSDTLPYLWLSRLLLAYAVKYITLSLTVPFTIGVRCKIQHLIFDCPVYYWRMLSNTSPYLWLSRLLLAYAVKYNTLSLTVPFTIGVRCKIQHLIFGCPVYCWRMLSDTSTYLWLSRLLLACAVKCLTVSLAATFNIGVCCQILYFWLPRLLLAYAVRCITLSLTAPFTIGVWCQIHHLDCPVYYWRMLSDTSPSLWLSRLLLACAVKYHTLSFALPFTIKYWCMLSNASPYLWLSRLLLSNTSRRIFGCPVYYWRML